VQVTKNYIPSNSYKPSERFSSTGQLHIKEIALHTCSPPEMAPLSSSSDAPVEGMSNTQLSKIKSSTPNEGASAPYTLQRSLSTLNLPSQTTGSIETGYTLHEGRVLEPQSELVVSSRSINTPSSSKTSSASTNSLISTNNNTAASSADAQSTWGAPDGSDAPGSQSTWVFDPRFPPGAYQFPKSLLSRYMSLATCISVAGQYFLLLTTLSR
jgi:hypothetical protein